MHNPDEVASWHLLQLADQGRPVETVAQFLASMWVSGGVGHQEIAQDCIDILDRTRELAENENLIWPGLLPGAPTMIETHEQMTHAMLEADVKTHPWEHKLTVWIDNRTEQEGWIDVPVNLESDLNIAAYLHDLAIWDGKWEFVTLIHTETGDKFLYTKDMVQLVVVMEKLDELAGRVYGTPTGDNDFQRIHEKAIDLGGAFYADR